MLRTSAVLALAMSSCLVSILVGCVPGDPQGGGAPATPSQEPGPSITEYSEGQKEVGSELERLQSIRNQVDNHLEKWQLLQKDHGGPSFAGELTAVERKIIDACDSLEEGAETLLESRYLAEYAGGRNQVEDYLRHAKAVREKLGS